MMDLQGTVTEVRPEAPRSSTLRIDLGGAAFPHRPGQFILIDPHQFSELKDAIARLEGESGKAEKPRAYSIASDGLDPSWIEISVKDNPEAGPYGQLLAPLLVCGLGKGRAIGFRGPAGSYGLPDPPPAGITGFLHVCAGSAVAPNRGMIRYALGKGWPQRHALVLQNRTPEDVFYKGEWDELLKRHSDRLRIRHVFTGAGGRRADAAAARETMAGWIDPASAFALCCGPTRPRGSGPGFVAAWAGSRKTGERGFFGELGFAPERVLTEQW